MKISKNQFDELWKIKISYYSGVTNRRIGETFFIPPLLLFFYVLGSDFDMKAILKAVLSCFAFLSIAMIISNHGSFMGKKRSTKMLPLKTLLFYVYDCSLFAMVFVSLWSMGNLIIQRESLPISLARFLIYLLLFMILLMVVVSPRILNTRSLDKVHQGLRNLPLLLAISGSIPGFGVLIFTLVSRSGNVDFPSSIVVFFTILGSFASLPYVVIGLYEVLLLGLRKWPEVKKSGSKYIVNGQEIS